MQENSIKILFIKKIISTKRKLQEDDDYEAQEVIK